MVAGHARGGVDDENDVFAVDRDPTDDVRRGPCRAVLEQSLHLCAQRLIRRHQLSFHDIGDSGVLLTRGVLPLYVRQIARQPGKLLPVALQGRDLAVQVPLELRRFATNLVQLHCQRPHLTIEIDAALLELEGLPDLGQHQQQDDRPETAADAVEKGEAEDLDLAPPPHQGQSFDGISKVPSVSRDRCQKRCAACVSPFIGSNIVSTGTLSGS